MRERDRFEIWNKENCILEKGLGKREWTDDEINFPCESKSATEDTWHSFKLTKRVPPVINHLMGVEQSPRNVEEWTKEWREMEYVSTVTVSVLEKRCIWCLLSTNIRRVKEFRTDQTRTLSIWKRWNIIKQIQKEGTTNCSRLWPDTEVFQQS